MMNEQELKEYSEYLVAQGFTPEEASQYLNEQGMVQEEQGMVSGLAGKGLRFGLGALDYLGGVTRTGAAQAVDLVGGENKVKTEDWKAALNPFDGTMAPGNAEYMERFGVPEGGKLSDAIPSMYSEDGAGIPFQKGGWADPTARGTAGFAGDMAMDPVNWVTFGGNSALKKALTPLSEGAKKAGKATYKSAFKKIDERLVEKGTKPLSEVMFKNRAWGGAESLQAQAKKIGDKLKAAREELYKKAQNLGAKVDVEKASQGALNEARRIKGIRGAKETGEGLEKHVESFYQPVEGPKVVGQVDLPGYKIEGKTVAPQYGPHGEILNADELNRSAAEVNLPGYTIKGKETINSPVRGVHGDVTNPEILTKSATEVPEHVTKVKIIREYDPATAMIVDKEVPITDPRPGQIVEKTAGGYQAVQFEPTVTKAPDVNLPDSSYNAVQFEGAKAPDVNIPDANYNIIDDPRYEFDWNTMQTRRKKLPPMGVSEASDLKTRFYDSLPDSAFNQQGKLKGDAKRVNRAMASGIKNELEAAANAVDPGLGNQIADINADWGSIIGSQKPLANEVRKANTKNAVSSVDAGMAGYALTHPVTGLPILVSKKLGDAAKTSSVRTGSGLALDRLGDSRILDPLTRQMLIDQNRSPWEQMKK